MVAASDTEDEHERPDSPAGTGPKAGAAGGAFTGMSGRTGRLAIAIGAVAALSVGYLLWPRGADGPPQARFEPPPVTVSRPLVEERIEWKEFTGQFEADEYVEVRARVSGYLKSIHFEDGKLVKKGELLFVIEQEPFEIALETAKAQLADALARKQLAEVQLARVTALRKKDFAAATTYDQRVAELSSASASVDIARAAVRTARLNLDYTRLTAPVSGRVSRDEVSVGNLIVGGSGGATTLLTTIVTLDPINFIFDVSEADSLAYRRAIETGEVVSARDNPIPVFAQLPDERNWPRRGAIDFVDNQFHRSSGTLRVRASFPNSDLFITPGQFGRIRVPVSKKRAMTLIPESAIVSDQARKVVYVVADDGTVGVKTVSLGPRVNGNLRIVRAGIAPDDRVIINGLLRARPGAKVKPEEGRIEPGGAGN